jgi:hypothetical protein
LHDRFVSALTSFFISIDNLLDHNTTVPQSALDHFIDPSQNLFLRFFATFTESTRRLHAVPVPELSRFHQIPKRLALVPVLLAMNYALTNGTGIAMHETHTVLRSVLVLPARARRCERLAVEVFFGD